VAMTPGRWRAVLFDLDGTLADTVELILRCYRHTMEVHLGERRPDREWLETIGTPLDVQLRAFADSEDEARAMLETYVSYQREVHDEMVRPFSGSREVVRTLVDRGVPLAVVTSKRREMALRTLERCGLLEAFPVVVAADDVNEPKPHPEPVLRAVDALGVKPGRDVVFIGDSPWDVRAGKGAGTRTAGALWGPYAPEDLRDAGPDALLAVIDDVLPFLGVGGDRERG